MSWRVGHMVGINLLKICITDSWCWINWSCSAPFARQQRGCKQTAQCFFTQRLLSSIQYLTKCRLLTRSPLSRWVMVFNNDQESVGSGSWKVDLGYIIPTKPFVTQLGIISVMYKYKFSGLDRELVWQEKKIKTIYIIVLPLWD